MSADGVYSIPVDAPLVSVLIPCFNHERYIEGCLESVISDGYPNVEIILIDDGSTDRSYDKAVEWVSLNQARFAGGVSILRQRNQGVVKTLNRLVSHAKGAYFVLVAGDDQLLPGGIASRLNYLIEHPGLLAVFGDARGVNDAGELLFSSVIKEKFRGNTSALSDTRFRAIELILNWCVPGPVFMADRRVTEVIGPYSEEFRIEDRDYYLRLLAVDKLGFLNKVVATYRFHSDALTGTRAKQAAVGWVVSEIDRMRVSHFRGARALALQINWCANSSRLTNVSTRKKIVVLMEVLLAKLASKFWLNVCRLVARAEQ